MNKLKITALTISLLTVAVYSILHTSYPAHAQQGNLISINPSQGDLKINDKKIISINVSSASGVSAFDLKFNTSGGLSISEFGSQPSFDNNFDLFNARNVAREINGSNSRISYVLTAATSNLPKTVTIYTTVTGSSAGNGKITLDYNNSQVLDGNGQALPVGPLEVTYNLNLNQSSAGFIDPAALPEAKYPDSAAVVDLKIKLAGANINPKVSSIKAIAVAVGRIGEGNYETTPQQFELTPNADGTFSGKVAFPDFKDGNKFSLMIKADKYLLKRVCDPQPSEQKVGGYACTEAKLTIRKGEPNNFDFSQISLRPGDLGLIDGILNGYDLNIVRMNLNKTSQESVALADLNYDGMVNAQDFEIINTIASTTKRRADQ